MPDPTPEVDPSLPFLLNGVNGTSGGYLPAPAGADDVYAAVTERENLTRVLESQHYENLRAREERARLEPFGLAAGIDPRRLDQTGWGVIFPADAPPALFEALRPLLEHRQSEAGKTRAEFYREFSGALGYQPGDDKGKFLKRLGRAVGMPADPRRGVPYYLLLVGGPRQIPWQFQSDLDVEYAVGRIYFETLDAKPDYDAYYRYSRSVVLAETVPLALPKSLTFFAPNHDPATAYSAGKLVDPLLTEMEVWNRDTAAGWSFDTHVRGEAKKSRLADLVGGARTPTVLFTASHGVGFEKEDNRQPGHQGGLVCQDIGAVRRAGRVSESAYFSADDVPDAARLHGLLTFHFACYAAGTPAVNDYPDTERKVFLNQPIAPYPFVARLPQRLLGHPNGGALGFVGHVDRVWSCSFLLSRNQEQIDVFSNFLKELLDGVPLGRALEYFNDRYAALAAALTSQFELVRSRVIPDEAFKEQVAANWLEHNDARNYVIFGDPAVRVRTAGGSAASRKDVAAELRRSAVQAPADTTPIPSRGAPASAPAPAPPLRQTPPPAPFDHDQIANTEQRYDALLGPAAFSFDTVGTLDLLQRNGRDRLTRRFRKLGLSAERAAAAADHVLGAHTGPIDFATGIPALGKDVGLERILGKNELLKARYLDLGLAAAGPVGRVTVRGPTRWFGTGFLVSPRLLLTNNHVLTTADTAASSLVEFDYQEGPDGVPLPVTKVGLDPAALFVTDRGLDFTLVAIRPAIDARARVADLGYLPMAGGDDAYVIGENVSIIQHPNGEMKQLALRDNQVIGESDGGYLHYRTGTMPGSSGSPVFNDEFELVALHHSGVPDRDPATRQILTADGQPWRQGMGEDQVRWLANEGVLVSAILAHLDGQRLQGAAADLLAELKAAAHSRRPRPSPREAAPVAQPARPTGTPRPPPVSGDQAAPCEAPGTTITIPLLLTIRIDVGAAEAAAVAGPADERNR
jgi:V8-like Glu-specific endopeptidase